MIVEGDRVIEIGRRVVAATFPPNVTFISKNACNEGSISFLDLEDTNMIWIEKFAFYNCRNLRSIVFPSTLKEIFARAFENCESLTSIKFSSGCQLREIGESAFKECKILNSIDFPDHIRTIRENAFETCWNIRLVDLSHTKLKYLGENAFGTGFLYKVRLPATVTLSSLLGNSFDQVEIDASHPLMKKDGNGNYTTNKIVYHGNKKAKHTLIRRGIEIVNRSCFQNAMLVSVILPSSLIEIQYHAFYKCEKLQHIRFSKNSRLEVIGACAFESCTSIKRVNFPKSLKKINSSAFSKTNSLEKVVFPPDSQLEDITSCFIDSNLKELSLPPSIKILNNYFNEIRSIYINNDLFVSNEEKTAVYSKDGSELILVLSYIEHFEIPSGVRVIKKEAFRCSCIKSKLLIPASVEVIEERAFCYCYDLKRIRFEEGSRLHTIGKDAFEDEIDFVIINNEHFKTDENGQVVSLDTNEVIFGSDIW